MEKIVTSGRLLFAVSITAFGAENLICARFGQPVMPVMPFVPGNPFLAYFVGVALLAAGLSLAANKRARLSAILLGILFLLCVLLFEISRVAAAPLSVGIRTISLRRWQCPARL